MNNRGKGLVAGLVALGAGALAFWQYKRLSPEKKRELKSKVSETGQKIKDSAIDAKNTITGKAKETRREVEAEMPS